MPHDPVDAPDGYPSRDAAVRYLTEYERRYELPVERPVRVHGVDRDDGGYRLDTSAGELHARAVVSATGTWAAPVVPMIPGQEEFRGVLLHSATYAGSTSFAGQRVIVVGGGNSGAQILAELSEAAHVSWATREPPHFLPDDVDGRHLFEQATARYRAIREGRTPEPARSLGDIVMVPPVRHARTRGVLHAEPMFTRFTETGVLWPGGREERIDTVIFATGFRPALDHLVPLGVVDGRGRVEIVRDGSGTRAAREPALWMLGYGDWTGFASATLIGVGRSARAAVDEIVRALGA
jgi:putative flavoprotein involved in K+ transport